MSEKRRTRSMSRTSRGRAVLRRRLLRRGVPGLAGRGPGARACALPQSRPRLRVPGPRPRVADERRGEGLPAHEPGGGDPAPGRARLRVVERVPPRRGPGRRRHRLPAGDRPRRHLRRAAHPRDGGRDRGRGPRQAPPVRAPGEARPLPGPHLLVAQHQHLPRPALGAGAGDVRGGPLSHEPAGCRLREGPAGRRPALLQGHRHRQALRRPQRPGAGPPPVRRPPQRARSPRDVPARVPRPGAGSEGGVRHGRLQPRQRRVGHGQPAPAAGRPAQGVGVRRVRGLGLRGHRRHLHAPQAGGDGGGGVGARGHEGLRPRVREHLPHPRKGARARPSPGGRPGRGGPPAHAGEDEARDVRSAGAGGVRADPVLGQRLAGARPPRAARGPGVDRPPEERRGPAPAQGPRHDRRRRAERGRPRHPARQLQRDALAAGHRPRGDPGRRLARHPCPLRARGRPRRGPAGSSRHRSHRGGLPASRPPARPSAGSPGRTSAAATSRASRC